MVNKLFLFISFTILLFSCKQSTSANQSEIPDLSEFKKVDVPVNKASEPANSSIKKETATTKQSIDKAETKVSEKNKVVVPEKETASTVKTKPKTTNKPINQSKPKVTYKPQIQFDEPIHEFGEITEGDIIEHKFAFKNTGKAELVIKSAKASCGCTNPSYPFIGIAPGETGFIGVTYNSVSKDGPQKPEVTIKTNVDDTSIILYLSGVVLPKEEVEAKEKEEGSKD